MNDLTDQDPLGISSGASTGSGATQKRTYTIGQISTNVPLPTNLRGFKPNVRLHHALTQLQAAAPGASIPVSGYSVSNIRKVALQVFGSAEEFVIGNGPDGSTRVWRKERVQSQQMAA